MLHKKPTSEQIKLARKGGYKNKRPSKPKANASLSVLKNYEERYNTWCKGVTDGVSAGKQRDTLRKEIAKR